MILTAPVSILAHARGVPRPRDISETQMARIVEWVRRAQEVGNFASPTALARAAGVVPSTINRLLGGDGHLPRLDTLEKIERASGHPMPRNLLTGRSRPGFAESDVARYEEESPSRALERQIQGVMAPRENIATMVVASEAMAQEGLLPGDRIVVDLDSRTPREDGDVVVLNYGSEGDPEAETLLRQLDGDHLVPRTSERGHRILSRFDNNLVIYGVVVASYRLPKVVPLRLVN